MTDLISRADAIKAIRKCKFESVMPSDWYRGMEDAQDIVKDVPSAELSKGDLISRADVLEGLKRSTASLHSDIYEIVNRIPSAEATGALDDAIAKYVADGLMELPSADAVQCDGKMIPIELKKRYPHSRDEDITDAFMRGYKSAQAVQGEWIDIDNYYRMATCSHCQKVTMFEKWGEYTKPYDFCPNCGARMKGGGE